MNTIQKQWFKFLEDIIENGEEHEKDGGDIIQEKLINHCFLDNPLKQFGEQNITSKMFVQMIKEGIFDIEGYPMKGEALAEYVSSFDDEYMIDGTDFVYTYPERLCNYVTVNKFGENVSIDQTSVMLKRLFEYDGSNRAVATLYNCGLDEDEEHIPCLNWLQATIRNNKLILHVMFRSNDAFSAWPSNMLFIAYIGIKLTEILKKAYPLIKFEGISYNSSSLHIYQGDREQAKEALSKNETF